MTKLSPSVLSASRRTDWLIGAVLVLTALAVFWPVLNHGFVNYDDPDYVTSNPHVQRGLHLQEIAWAFRSLFIYWQPLTWLSYMLDNQLFGPSARAFHATDLLLHLANTLLLFLVLKRMTSARWPSAIVAALFALHPLHVETVAWISERKGSLSTLFWLLAIGAYVRYAEKPGRGRYAWVLALFALGLMAKSMVVTLPCVLLLLDFWPLGRWQLGRDHAQTASVTGPKTGTTRRSRWPLFYEKLPFFALAAISSLLTIWAQQRAGHVWPLAQFSLTQRFAHAFAAYASYLRKTFWPSDLAVFYPHHAVANWQVAGAAVLVAGVSCFVWRAARRQPYLLVGWFWFLGTLVPVIGILQTGDQALADRYTYIPLIGLFIAVTWGVRELAKNWRARKAVLEGLAFAAVLACACLTSLQVRHWQNTQTLFVHAQTVTRNNQVADTVVGSLLAEAGKFAEATNLYARALQAVPTFSDAHFHWGLALEKRGQFDEALAHFAEAVRLKPNFVEAHISMGLALAKQRRYDDAIRHYHEALRFNPDSAAAHNNLAMALHSLGKLDDAIAKYTTAVKINPKLAVAHQNLALALHAKGRLADATAHYETALRLTPNSASAHLNLAGVLKVLKRDDEALQHYREALRLDPESPQVLSKLAWFRATHVNPKLREGAEALRLAERANQLTSQKDPMILSALAAAQAEIGRFAEAAQTMQKAIDLAASAGEKKMADAFQSLLHNFKEGRPYREGS